MRRSEAVTEKKGGYILEMVKALVLSLIFTLVLVLLAALLVWACDIPENVIPIINQIIKGVSILIPALICLRLPGSGWIRGLLFGILYIALTEFIFALLNSGNGFTWGIHILNDVAIGSITGLISGILAVNVIRGRKNVM